MPRSVKRNVSRKRNPKYNTKKRKLTKKIGSQKGGGAFAFKWRKQKKGLKNSKFKKIKNIGRPVPKKMFLPSKKESIKSIKSTKSTNSGYETGPITGTGPRTGTGTIIKKGSTQQEKTHNMQFAINKVTKNKNYRSLNNMKNEIGIERLKQAGIIKKNLYAIPNEQKGFEKNNSGLEIKSMREFVPKLYQMVENRKKKVSEVTQLTKKNLENKIKSGEIINPEQFTNLTVQNRANVRRAIQKNNNLKQLKNFREVMRNIDSEIMYGKTEEIENQSEKPIENKYASKESQKIMRMDKKQTIKKNSPYQQLQLKNPRKVTNEEYTKLKTQTNQ